MKKEELIPYTKEDKDLFKKLEKITRPYRRSLNKQLFGKLTLISLEIEDIENIKLSALVPVHKKIIEKKLIFENDYKLSAYLNASVHYHALNSMRTKSFALVDVKNLKSAKAYGGFWENHSYKTNSKVNESMKATSRDFLNEIYEKISPEEQDILKVLLKNKVEAKFAMQELKISKYLYKKKLTLIKAKLEVDKKQKTFCNKKTNNLKR